MPLISTVARTALRSATPAAPRPAVGPPARHEAIPATLADHLLIPFDGGVAQYANLDHAASTPALVGVKTAVDRALATYSSVHRGNGYASRVTSRWYEEARTEVAAFLGARPDDTVVFTRSTTDSWSVLAHVLPQDTTVVVFATEHHSTLLPWGAERTITLPVPTSLPEALGRLEATVAAVTNRHCLVVITAASNVTGEIWPIDRIAEITARHGARLAVDAAQFAPHRPIDLASSGIDYLAFSGHKLYAPFGTGVLAGRSDWLDDAAPYLIGGGATARVTSDENPTAVPAATWAAGAARHEGGSPNVIGAIALAAACSALRRSWAAVQAHEERLAQRLRDGLAAIQGVHTYSIFGDEAASAGAIDRVGVVAFTVDGVASSDISAAVSFEYGIGVRDGKFCAHLLVDHLLAGTGHDTAVRASVGLATTDEHVERLIAAIGTIAGRGRAGTWTTPVDTHLEDAAVRPW